jgi:hypothetical protein
MSAHRRRGTAAAIGLCVSMVTGGLVLGQDSPRTGPAQGQAGEARYDLRANYPFRLGEKVRVVDGARHEGLVNVLRRGKPLRVENRRGGYELRYTDEVQGVAPRGGVTRVLRTYERVKDWATGQEDRTPRTAVLDYTGEALSVTRKGDLSPIADRLLTTETKVPFSAQDQMIPSLGPIPVGTRWTIPNGPAAQIFLLDPANLADGSVCTGVLHSVRTQKGVEQVRVVVTFDLRVKKIYDITFDEPATLACTLDLWSTANGAAPGSSGTFTGSMKGEGAVEGAPEDVSVQLTVTVTGTIQQELLATTR